jgi:hypothetical protein
VQRQDARAKGDQDEGRSGRRAKGEGRSGRRTKGHQDEGRRVTRTKDEGSPGRRTKGHQDEGSPGRQGEGRRAIRTKGHQDARTKDEGSPGRQDEGRRVTRTPGRRTKDDQGRTGRFYPLCCAGAAKPASPVALQATISPPGRGEYTPKTGLFEQVSRRRGFLGGRGLCVFVRGGYGGERGEGRRSYSCTPKHPSPSAPKICKPRHTKIFPKNPLQTMLSS